MGLYLFEFEIGVACHYDRWIKPMEGLNAGTFYTGRPPGNGPEFMPLDASLNQDVDCAVVATWLSAQ